MTTAITPKAKTDSFMHEVVARKATYRSLLPKDMDPEWFAAEVRIAVARAPGLLDCDRVSVFDAISTCAQLGLSPSGRLGSAYLIPYRDKCTIVVGYRGLADLAYRSGEITDIGAQVVHENDEFRATDGFKPEVHHVRTEEEPGALRAVYAWANTRQGGTIRVVMLRREVAPIMAAALAKKRAGGKPIPWETNEEEMWKKTALRRLFKLAPLSPSRARMLSRALEVEDADFEDVSMEDGAEPAPRQSTTARIKEELRAKALPAQSSAAPLEVLEARPVSRQPSEDEEPTQKQLDEERAQRARGEAP